MAELETYQGDDGGSVRNIVAGKQPPSLLTTLKKTFVVVGSATIVFVALRNSLTYHLQQFWGASGNFWQHQWDKIVDLFEDDTFNLMVYGTTLVSYLVYWSIGMIYTFFDVFNWPKFIHRYKIQPGTNEPAEPWKVLKVILQVHFNMIVVGLAFATVAYYTMRLRGYDDSRTLPPFHWVLFELIVCILLEEVGFYYSHRLFHHRFLYKHFHKQHHEWQSPIAITALYAHPLEHAMSNLFPPFLGLLVLGSHIATSWLWISLATLSTLNAHSGYHLPFFPSPEAHDFHHLKFNQCYGVLGVLDLLHGTDEKFRASKCFSRHIMMLSLVPPLEAFPEEEPMKTKSINKPKQC